MLSFIAYICSRVAYLILTTEKYYYSDNYINIIIILYKRKKNIFEYFIFCDKE